MGGCFSLSGSSGQADAGEMSGGNFTLNGGCWPGVTDTTSAGYLPLIVK